MCNSKPSLNIAITGIVLLTIFIAIVVTGIGISTSAAWADSHRNGTQNAFIAIAVIGIILLILTAVSLVLVFFLDSLIFVILVSGLASSVAAFIALCIASGIFFNIATETPLDALSTAKGVPVAGAWLFGGTILSSQIAMLMGLVFCYLR